MRVSAPQSARLTILSIVLPAALTVLLFVLTIFLLVLPALQSHMMDRKREMIRELTRTAWGVLAHYQAQEEAGELSREEAQAKAIAHLRNVRYGSEDKDYFWITDRERHGILHPHSPQFEGQDLSDLTDSNGVRLYEVFTRVANDHGEGFVEYDWQWQDDPNKIVPKVSYLKVFEPWDWLVGTGIYVEDVRREIAAGIRKLTGICLGILVLVAALSWWMIRKNLRIEAQRQQAETALRTLNTELEERVAHRTAEIRERNETLRATVSDLQDRERTMAEELELAQEVQMDFLPKAFPFTGELQFAALYRSTGVVGGDLYDAFRVNDRTAGFYIADASGHGVSAALVTAVLKVSFERFREGIPAALESEGLAQLVDELNNALQETIPDCSFVTFLLGILHLDSGELLLANAGHFAPLRYRTGVVDELPVPSNLPLGTVAEWHFQIATSQLQPGDKLVIHTDGITELRDDGGEEYGRENLVTAIQTHGHLPPEALLAKIQLHTSEFAGNQEPIDDQAILVVDYQPKT